MAINCNLKAQEAFGDKYEKLIELAGKNSRAKKMLAEFEPTSMSEVRSKLQEYSKKYGNDTEKFRKKTQEFLNSIRRTKLERRLEMVDTAIRKTRFAQELDGFEGDAFKLLESKIIGTKKGYKGEANSVDSRAAFHISDNHNYVHSNFTRDELKLLSNRDALDEQFNIMMILEYMDEHGNVPESAVAKHQFQDFEMQLAKKVKGFNNHLHKKMTDAGVDLGYVDNFSVSRSYDFEKIALTDRDAVVRDLAENGVLDPETFKNVEEYTDAKTGKLVTRDEQIMDIIKGIVDGWQERGRGNPIEFDLTKSDTQGRSSVSARMERNRVLQFTPEGVVNFMKKYGNKSLGESVLSQIQTVGRRVALIETLGKNPAATFTGMKQLAVDKIDKEIIALKKIESPDKKELSRLKKLEAQRGKIEKLNRVYEHAVGFNKAPTNDIANNLVDGLNAFTYWSKLGTSGFAAVNDVATMIAQYSARTGTSPFKAAAEVVTELASGSGEAFAEVFSRKGTTAFMQEMAEYGFALDTAMGAVLQKMGIDIDSKFSKFGAAMNNFHDVINPLGVQLLYHKHVFTTLMSSRLGSQVKSGKLTPSSLRTLDRAGITSDYMPALKQMVEGIDGQNVSVLNPSSAANISDEVAEKVLKNLRKSDPTITMDIAGVKRDLQQKLSIMYLETAADAAPTPGAREDLAFRVGDQENTWIQAGVKLIKPLKSISVKMLSVTEGLYHANPNKSQSMINLSQHIMMGMGIAYLSISMKEMAKGKTPPDINDPETIKNMMAYSGYGGIYADLAIQMLGGSGRSPADSLLGPSFGTIKDAARIAGKAGQGELEEKDVVNFGLSNMPFGNHFLLRPAFDSMFLDDYRNSIDPNRRRRMRKMMRDRGQQYIWR